MCKFYDLFVYLPHQSYTMQGKTINGFTLQRLLGVGGMAEVWYAENEIGMKAAVKILSDELSRNAQMRERFLNEAKVMVQLDHPNIRKVYGYGSIDDRPVIIMEYLEGEDLKARLKHGQRPYDSDTSSDFEISEQIVYKPLDRSGLRGTSTSIRTNAAGAPAVRCTTIFLPNTIPQE